MHVPSDPLEQFHVDRLPVSIYRDEDAVGEIAATRAAEIIERAIAERGVANVVFATGNSQSTYFKHLRRHQSIDWPAVNLFMIDQYLGVDPLRRGTLVYLEAHLLGHVHPRSFHPISSSPGEAERMCDEYAALLARHPLDLASVGWGENGHLAFNDPHNADFDDPAAMKVVALSAESRRQPVSEGRFDSIDEVPTHAITMTIPAILAAKRILCIVPERRKAVAVRNCLRETISTERPGSILRRIDHAELLLDSESAANLDAAAFERRP